MMDKASDALDNFSDEYGDDIMQAIDDLQNAEYQDGPFCPCAKRRPVTY